MPTYITIPSNGADQAPVGPPVTMADGANVTLGAKADTAGVTPATAGLTLMQRISGLWTTIWNTATAPGTPASAAVTVQGNASGVAVPVSATGLSRIPALGQAAMANSTPVAIASDQSVVNVQGSRQTQFISAIVHETAKTLNAEDVIGPATTPLDAVIAAIVPVAAQPFRILQARLEIDSIVASVLAAQIEVILYNDAAAVTPIAGNSQNTWLYANGIKRLGRIQFGPFNTSGTGSTMAAAYGSFQDGKAAFTDLFPVAQAISWRCVNKVTGTVFATGQNVRLILDVCYQ